MKCFQSAYFVSTVTTWFVFLFRGTETVDHAKVFVNTTEVLEVVDKHFVGVTLDTTLIKDGWLSFDFQSTKLGTLVQGLSPIYLRVGGTSADCLIFDPWKRVINKPWTKLQEREEYVQMDLGNFTMSSSDWDNLNKFSVYDWAIIFDLNVLLRKDGCWDPSNAQLLLNYTVSHGYKVAGFQLGNEPNAFHHVFGMTIPASKLAEDFQTLQGILHSYPHFTDSMILGPDVTQVSKKDAKDYFKQFLATGGGKIVNKTTFHHYYVNGRNASLEDFLDPAHLDFLKEEIQTAIDITHTYAPTAEVWLGETGSAYGGGAKGLSDAFVAGFMWMDKLGMSAKHGVKGVLRQSFYKGSYGMLDQDTLDPLPDYWLTVLYKRLVGGPVFNVTTTVSTDDLRVYAHCTNMKSMYQYWPGSVTLYAMNLKPWDLDLSLPQFTGGPNDVFWLTAGTRYDLKSKKVKLNGKTLEIVKNELPDLLPVQVSSRNISIPAMSFGFIVIPSADVEACR